MSQGQSESTEFKVRGIVAAAVNISARIHASKFGKRYPFWIFDLFCGSGYNDRVDCVGSPVAMLAEAERCGVAPRLHCVDFDQDALARLSTNSAIRDRIGRDVFLHHGDNCLFHAHAAAIVSQSELAQKAMGIALYDPNDSRVNLESLSGMSRLLPCVDIVINYSGGAIKRAVGAGAVRNDLNELILAANKRHWLIRRPIADWQWSLLIGRNIPVRDYRSMGFEHLDGDAGRAIVQTLLMTKKAMKDEAAGRLGSLGF